MRRRRMGRSGRKNEKYGAVTTVLVLLLVAAFVYAFQSLGIYDILFKPAFNDNTTLPGSQLNSAQPGASAATTTAAAQSGEKITEEIKMGAITLYGVQLGVFTKLENAQTVSDKFKKDGSAGYVLKEEALYRVVDSVYYTEGDAKTLRDQYRKGLSPDACLLKVEASGINWNVNATREQVDAIRNAVSVIQNQLVALINTQKAAQQNQGTADDWKNAAGGAATQFRQCSETLMKAVGSTNTSVIINLNEFLLDSADNLANIANMDAADPVALISGLKYSIIDMLLRLQKDIMG